MTDKLINDEDLLNRAAHHPPGCQHIIDAHEEIRMLFGGLAVHMNNLLPEGPLKTTAINRVFDAMNAANTCVAVMQDVFDHGMD